MDIIVSNSVFPTSGDGWYLRVNTWDDFGFRTTFELIQVASRKLIRFGDVKIGSRLSSTTELPAKFSRLNRNEFFSLGQSENYYESLRINDEGQAILEALNDCVARPEVRAAAQSEEVFRVSLMRGVRPEALERFRTIWSGTAVATSFEFTLPFGTQTVGFAVLPRSLPPTNVHALIGANGVGKSHFMNTLVTSIVNEDSVLGSEFSGVVSIAFSAFDRFLPVVGKRRGRVNYSYVGMRTPDSGLKSPADLEREFSAALEECLTGPRRQRWLDAVEHLRGDLLLAAELGDADIPYDDMVAGFSRLSSGHKLALLIVTRLVELVDERTLVLIDEPESHLHPPLLSGLLRAISNLMSLRNAVAIVATHSPVVLQEIPAACVWVVRRMGEHTRLERPAIETFGENAGVLTREVFQLEVTGSGFYRLIAERTRGMRYDEARRLFGGQLGGEAMAYLRVLTEFS